MSKITLNVVEPGTKPVDPGIDPSVPNTGLFTNGIGGPEATIIVSVVLVLAIVSIALTAYMYMRHKKAGKTTKLVHIIDSTKAVLKSKKRTSAGLAAIALLISAGTFIALVSNSVNASDTEDQAKDETNLTVSTSDQELTIEVGDEPVFAVLPVEVSVEEATPAGYTLTTYTENTDLISTTDESNIIPMITADEEEPCAEIPAHKKRELRSTAYNRVEFTSEMKSRNYTILAPQMAPIQFDLVKEAFQVEGYDLVILDNDTKESVDVGLKYVNNDACYPSTIVVGQMMAALLSGRYDLSRTALLITQTGGGCRATNYISFIRRALEKAGFGHIPVISLSFGLEKNSGFKLSLPLAYKGI